MSVTSYHHGNLRAALVETGLAMARESGPDGVALREVARRVGVSHNAAYRHFADREALLGEIAQVGMQRLTEAMHQRMAEVVPGLDAVARAQARLRAVGRAYVEFALAEPGLFRTAFSALAHASPVEPAGTAEEDQGPYALLNTVLDELVEAGHLAPERRPSADVTCWAGVHGIAVLHLDGPLAGAPEAEREATMVRFFDIVERGLGGGPGGGPG
ncbi:TetR/AcrR family transcriptional regulator [Nocardioides sp.]|uniref:TetR/AcrR family transcriptional regulator n=1 Tax=Nocardioides sp. TaxID=35761 RepID=UPI001A2DE057|nr:TetR/AcrR family transcriptional regulator [Nocardioides sp.]MBJ7358155.1 TetR/AcrR family transcriptional regulator [Nocardioides sp.]